MALKQIRVLDYEATFDFAPPAVDAVINTDEVISAVPCKSRRSERVMEIRFSDGSRLVAIGIPSDLLSTQEVQP